MTQLDAIKNQVEQLEARIAKLEDTLKQSLLTEDAVWMEQLYRHAKELVIKHHRASATFLQRKLMIDYERAGKLLAKLQDEGIIGPATESEPRQVLVD